MFDDKISLEDYHDLPAMSAHNFMDASANCVIAEYNKRLKVNKLATKAMINGTLIHTATETQDIGKYYAVEPTDINKRTNAGKQQLAKFYDSIGDKIPITQDQWDMAEGCMEAAWSHPDAKILLHCAKFERSGFTTLQGIDVKARPDLDCTKEIGVLADIKSRQFGKADAESWLMDFWKYKTYIQAGLQMLVWEANKIKVKDYYYILIETAAPYEVNVVFLDEELIEASKDLTLRAIDKWKLWLKEKSPAGYGKPQALSLKSWMQNQILYLL